MSESTINTVRSTGITSPIRVLPRTEEELLEREAQYAERGLVRSLRDLGYDAVDAIDLRKHARRHPLVALAAAAVAGFFLQGRLRAMARGDKASLTSALLLLMPISKLIQSSVVGAFSQKLAAFLFKR